MRAFIFFACIFLINCNSDISENQNQVITSNAFSDKNSSNFNEYWYSGKAEVASYKLTQSRYGEERVGTAALIFVTEPFSKNKQVKLDNDESEDKLTVLKMNFTKKFVTGIYPYSMMLSVFTPVDSYNFPNTIKETMSSQEWCGQTYSQINLNKNNYSFQGNSYFETEGDIDDKFEKVLLEDELWNKIRINPNALPEGNVELLPGLFYSRLYHKDIQPEVAFLSLTKLDTVTKYTIEFKNRELEIQFHNEFPYKILFWREEIAINENEKYTTTGTLMKTLHIDYWNKNSNKFLYLRDSLNLN